MTTQLPTQTTSEESKVQPDGMYFSDRCKFCREFGEKARPRVCFDCLEMARELMRQEGWGPQPE